MGNITAMQTAELTATVVGENLQKYVEFINANIKPPVPVTPAGIIIRAMYIISDGLNSYGGRFDRADLPEIAKLFIDSPVLIGHDKSGLPVARNFWAETVEKNNRLWIKSYFYWLSGTDGADRLRMNIDSGIYKECSVSFTYTIPECSACGKDIRQCGHQIGDDIFFYYRDVERILESSLVYRGSIPDTSITDKLAIGLKSNPENPETGSGNIYTLSPSINYGGNPIRSINAECFKARINSRDFLLVKEKGDI